MIGVVVLKTSIASTWKKALQTFLYAQLAHDFAALACFKSGGYCL